jgi:hypothetical protein
MRGEISGRLSMAGTGQQASDLPCVAVASRPRAVNGHQARRRSRRSFARRGSMYAHFDVWVLVDRLVVLSMYTHKQHRCTPLSG